MKFKDLPQDTQFTLLNPTAADLVLKPDAVFQKSSDTDAMLINDIVFSPETEVQEVS